MPFLYAQVKEHGDQCLIKHYLLDIPSLLQLRSFCNDKSEAGRVLQILVQELVTFSPVYDNVISAGGFADDVEFLEEEIYSGSLTNEIAEWLMQISEQSGNLLPGRIGMHLPGQNMKETPCKTRDSIPLIVKASHTLRCAVEQLGCSCEIKNSLKAMQSHSFLFRSIYLKIPKNWQNAECGISLFERIESHAGKSSEDARVLACNSGFLQAALDMKYSFPDSVVIFIGIESFAELPMMCDSPMLLACQTTEWPWKYDLIAFKRELLAEILAVNTTRQKEGLSPFWL